MDEKKIKETMDRIEEGVIVNRIMILRLANAVGMLPATMDKFQDESIAVAKKEMNKIRKEGKKNDKNIK